MYPCMRAYCHNRLHCPTRLAPWYPCKHVSLPHASLCWTGLQPAETRSYAWPGHAAHTAYPGAPLRRFTCGPQSCSCPSACRQGGGLPPAQACWVSSLAPCAGCLRPACWQSQRLTQTHADYLPAACILGASVASRQPHVSKIFCPVHAEQTVVAPPQEPSGHLSLRVSPSGRASCDQPRDWRELGAHAHHIIGYCT